MERRKYWVIGKVLELWPARYWCCWQLAVLLGHYVKWCNWVKRWQWAVLFSLSHWAAFVLRDAHESRVLRWWCLERLLGLRENCGFLVLASSYFGSWNRGGGLVLHWWVPDLWRGHLLWRGWMRWPGTTQFQSWKRAPRRPCCPVPQFTDEKTGLGRRREVPKNTCWLGPASKPLILWLW